MASKRRRGLGQAQALGRIQGIGKNLDDLTLNGRNLRAIVGDAFTGGSIKRGYSGASTITTDLKDSERKLLNSPLLKEAFTIELDGLGFSYVKANMTGIVAPLTLTFEDREVHRLRQFTGPKKAYRDKVTRAEFIQSLVLEAAKGFKPGIDFYAYELHQTQPIKNSKQGDEARVEADQNRAGGLGDASGPLMIWAVGGPFKADSAAIEMADRILRVGQSLHAPYVVLVAAIATVMAETGITDAVDGPFAQTTHSAGFDIHDTETAAAGFYQGTFAAGATGAIAYAKAHPDATAGEIAYAVEKCYSAYAYKYTAATPLARKMVDAYLGGSGAPGTTETVTTVERYAYEVKKGETYWAAIQRLAKEVRWRAFCSAGRVYFVTDDYLLRSRRRLIVAPGKPGIDDISFDFDTGKVENEMRVTARAGFWSAPPGSCVTVTDCGPADGAWLVSSIESPLRRVTPVAIDVTLKRPAKPLPEPAASTSTRTFGGGTSTPDGMPQQIAAMIAEIERIDAKHYDYSSPGARGTPPPASGPYDCSGFMSRILYVGGLLKTSIATPQLAGIGEAGVGDWFYMRVRPPAGPSGHVIGRIRTADGWRWFATSSSHPDWTGSGAGWVPDSAYSEGYLATLPVVRHFKGL